MKKEKPFWPNHNNPLTFQLTRLEEVNRKLRINMESALCKAVKKKQLHILHTLVLSNPISQQVEKNLMLAWVSSLKMIKKRELKLDLHKVDIDTFLLKTWSSKSLWNLFGNPKWAVKVKKLKSTTTFKSLKPITMTQSET